MHEVLVNCLLKLAQRSTDRPDMTIAVDLGRKATKQTNSTLSVLPCLLAGNTVPYSLLFGSSVPFS